MKIDFNANKAKELTMVVNEIGYMFETARKCNSLWNPIIKSIKDGNNVAIITISNDEEMKFVNELKELGYDVKIENERFYTEAIIKW